MGAYELVKPDYVCFLHSGESVLQCPSEYSVGIPSGVWGVWPIDTSQPLQ